MDIKSSKAQSLSFHTIIIAVLALLVLVVVIYLIIGSLNTTKSGTSCSSLGGICMESCSGIYETYTVNSGDNPECNSGDCCKLKMG